VHNAPKKTDVDIAAVVDRDPVRIGHRGAGGGHCEWPVPPPSSGCRCYSRWTGLRVELSFKWIKQHLRIKAFFGTSQNAVKTQIWIAVSIYVLVSIIHKRL